MEFVGKLEGLLALVQKKNQRRHTHGEKRVTLLLVHSDVVSASGVNCTSDI